MAAYGNRLVEVTRGEPLLQKDTPRLIQNLLDYGYTVLLETNGSQDISLVDNRCVRIVDIKCPSSNEKDKNDLANLDRLTDRDELKFIIADQGDYEYAKEILKLMARDLVATIPIHFSPCYGKIAPKELAEWILDDRLNVRLHLQIHKYIWGPEQRRV